MNYNPQKHHRRSIRLKGYDYSQAGLYFITICCDDRKHRFGTVANGQMQLNEFGQIAWHEWGKLSERFPNITLDVFQIMPNHVHGVIMVGATLAVAPNVDDAVAPNDKCSVAPTDNGSFPQNKTNGLDDCDKMILHIGAGASPAPTSIVTIGDMVGAYKSLVSRGCLEIYKSKHQTMGKLWQRNYYEHIIRNEQSYRNISDYIINNPAKWTDDRFCDKETME